MTIHLTSVKRNKKIIQICKRNFPQTKHLNKNNFSILVYWGKLSPAVIINRGCEIYIVAIFAVISIAIAGIYLICLFLFNHNSIFRVRCIDREIIIVSSSRTNPNGANFELKTSNNVPWILGFGADTKITATEGGFLNVCKAPKFQHQYLKQLLWHV